MNGVVLVHALAALLFGAVAAWQWNGVGSTLPQRRLLLALGATALWALAVAGVGNADVTTRVLLSARDLAWLWMLAGIAARAGEPRWRGFAFATTALCATLPAVLAITAEVVPVADATQATIGATALALRMLYAAAAAVLAYRCLLADERGAGGRRVVVAVLALLWSTDLANTAVAYFMGGWSVPMLVARGITALLVAPLIAVAVQRGGAWQLSVSQAAAVRTVGFGVAALYMLGTAVVVGALGQGGDARMIQTAVVVGAATSLLTLASTPWLRAWTKVTVAKHLFAHRYDYRAAWIRFGETLRHPDHGSAPLTGRVLEALAQLTDSPGALLLLRDRDALPLAAHWRWPEAEGDGGGPLVAHLEATRRIVDLGEIGAGRASADAAAVPAWLAALDGGWALVPLIHFDRLVGVVVLAAPLLSRPLDWEDFDLLGVAGQQAASLLAEEQAAAALSEARRFEEFNRRFAFIMHDLKNLVSQTALVARNAERHGDDPAFRADMVATLRDASQRMTALLARLGGHAAQVAEPPAPVPLRALAERIAGARRALHAIEVRGDPHVVALVQAAALEAALAHLIQNAMEASASGVPVEIAVGQDGDRAVITVTDHGRGMSPAFIRDELFRPFASAKTGGFGLGAFEARQLVEQLGGTLSVVSREGEGTCFALRLPAAPALEEAA